MGRGTHQHAPSTLSQSTLCLRRYEITARSTENKSRRKPARRSKRPRPSSTLPRCRRAKPPRSISPKASRDPLDERGSFASNLFIGRFDFDRIFPFRSRAPEDRAAGEPFLAELRDYLEANVDADEIDRTGEIPQKNIDDLFAMGAFGIKIPKQYGGLGLSQTNYCRAAMLLGSWDANLTALVSAHQSIGVPQPLILFGTEEQKAKFLPRVAARKFRPLR